MTAPLIPLSRASLAVWPATQHEPPRFRVLVNDGPLPDDRWAKLRGLGGYVVPAAMWETWQDAYDWWDRIAASPGWADGMAAWVELNRVDLGEHDRARVAADCARRVALMRDCATWGEAMAALVAAGEVQPSTVAAMRRDG